MGEQLPQVSGNHHQELGVKTRSGMYSFSHSLGIFLSIPKLLPIGDGAPHVILDGTPMKYHEVKKQVIQPCKQDIKHIKCFWTRVAAINTLQEFAQWLPGHFGTSIDFGFGLSTYQASFSSTQNQPTMYGKCS